MPTFVEAPRPTEAIISEGNGFRSRDQITIMASQTLLANQVIGRIVTVATVAFAAGAGNTGNGVLTLGTPQFSATAVPGVYRVVFIEPVTNLGTFLVEAPNGVIVGRGVVGTLFAGPVRFTIADGATDFVAGDEFQITVSAVVAQWGAYDPGATDGRAVPAGVLFGPVTTGVGVTAQATAFTRAFEANAQKLQWFSGATAPQIAAGIALLNASPAGIVVR
jgi:hypothetical protein